MLHFDSHVHIGNNKIKISAEHASLLAYKEYSPVTPEGYMRKALACGISKAVIFPFPLMEISFERQNSYIIEAAQKYPYFFVPFLIPEAVHEMEKYHNQFVGIKDHFYFDFHKQVNHEEILEYAQANNKIYLFHAHWKHWGDRIKQICNNFPKLRVVVAHAGRPAPFLGINLLDKIEEYKELIPTKLRENFFFETSTIRDSRAIVDLVNAFGDDHILWGSDFPYYFNKDEQVLPVELAVIENAKIPDSSKEKIFTGNFRVLFQHGEIWIRQAMPDDSQALLGLLSQISEQEQKFLVLSLKLALIKKQMKSGGHILVAESPDGELVGFLRGSDRHDRCVMIEEIYVSPKARGQHVATRLINAICPSYRSAEVKNFASNVAMNEMLTRLKFTPKYSPKGTMITWRR